MARKIPPLTDRQCKTAVYAKGGKNKRFDGGGLYLEILPSGYKRWRLKYRRPDNKKENALTLGPYPDLTLLKARELRDKAKQLLLNNEDPESLLELESSENTFKKLAEEWLEIRRKNWSAGYYTRVRNALIADAYPYIGKLDIDKISGKRVLDAVRKVEARGALEMASRVLEAVGMVFRYAVGTGYVQSDVTQGLRQFLQDRPPVEHHPHVCAETLPSLLKRVDQYHGRPETRLAIKLMMRTFPRTNELRWAEWTEIDFESQIWSIPSSRMKGSVIEKQSGNPHIVPLSSQCTRILRQLQEYTGRYNLLFPGMGKSPKIPMSAETINKALKVMGFEGRQTGHGFRGLASTIMHEQSGISSLAIEKQLAHKDRNKIRRTYNHAEYLDERRLLMQWWSDFLDSQRSRE